MTAIRIIPRLDIKGPNLVKGIHLEGLRVLGSPKDFAKYYYEQGADELIYQDVVASLYERNSLHDIISETAGEIFIPLTVGGGLRTIQDITGVLRAGADKVCLNTAVINNPEIITEAALKFGSSTIVVAIEAIKEPDGRYLAYTDNGREYTGLEVVEWAKKLEEIGAGELIVTSVDNEGTGVGYDIELTKLITDEVNIPVIAHGGAGKMEHFKEVLLTGGATAVTMASMLHYYCVENASQIFNAQSEGNVEFLKSGKSFGRMNKISIQEVKNYLIENGFEIRT
ncbi:imidazole glycerol phosphate synthase cyclase subunit [uncultured Roseivirga sp.]|uniref:imidazole glycerol phosphate synthase subunit HisF n=1 Tax=uncultured Roseivirga sp. TaxID=543088 RepID=UPI0030DBB99E|tara:strand:- start:537 stop:1385 length:849 start_codon:yes stop_codon:yes gene_type:complete